MFLFSHTYRIRPQSRRMMSRLVTGLLLAGLVASLGISVRSLAEEAEWKELDAPPAPGFSMERLIPLDMPSYTSLIYGVDSATLSLDRDGVIRFVMVARSSSGTINAFHEGLRCATGEYKVYARSTQLGQWTQVKEPEWKALDTRLSASHHALALARQGACDGSTPAATTTAGLLQALRSPRRNSH